MHPIKLLFFIVLIAVQSCTTQTPKINGISFVASRSAVNKAHITPVVNINANYASIMPFGFIQHLEHPEIGFNTERQWFGEKRVGVLQYVEALRERDIKIMVKPQIWVRGGAFTGKIKMTAEKDWKLLETTYKTFILEYAKLAEEVHAEIFCIATELENFITHRPEFWLGLISEIKTIYKGQLTYAANWDEYVRTPFWNELDFIGVDAYFPVSNSQTPTIAECLEGWKLHKPEVQLLSEKYNKPILFTEFGYRSVDFTGKEPWNSDRNMTSLNLDAQTNATKALFETFWKEQWFAGGFIWKWFHNYDKSGGEKDNRFTPQNKPVEAVIKQHYGLH